MTENTQNQKKPFTIAKHLGTVFVGLILAAGFGLTYVAQKISLNNEVDRLEKLFSNENNYFTYLIKQRLNGCIQALESINALFYASDAVSRDEFAAFINQLNIANHYPGIVASGFVPLVNAPEKPGFINTIKQEGLPDFTIFPAGDREQYAPVTYIEPMNESNVQALGFDLFSETERRNTMLAARDSGEAKLSGKLVLMQDPQHNHAAVILFAPIYKNKLPHEILTERRSNLMGWSYVAIFVDDLLLGILGTRDLDIDLEIFDGLQTTPETMLYDSDFRESGYTTNHPMLESTQSLTLNGHSWTIKSHSLPEFEALLDLSRINLIRIFGLTLTVMLALLIWELDKRRNLAILQTQVTALELKKSEQKSNVFLIELKMQKYAFDQHAIVSTTDLDGTITYVNQKFCDISGYTEQELIGQNHRILKSGVHSHEFYADMYATLLRGEVWEAEICNLNKAGDTYWSLTTIVPCLDENNAPNRYIAIRSDITARKLVEDNLRITDLALREISQGVVISDAEQNVLWVNKAYTEITGFTLEDVQGKPCCIIQSLRFDQQKLEDIRQTLNAAKKFSTECICYRKDGSSFWNDLSMVAVHNAEGMVINFIGVTRDITSRKNVELSLLDSEKSLREILNLSPIAVRIAVNNGHKVVFYNKSYAKMINDPNPVGIDPAIYYQNPEVYRQIVADLYKQHTIFNREIELQIPSTGEKLWVLSSYMLTSFQAQDAVLSWFFDITEKHEAAKTLLAAKELAEESTRMKSVFLANMSHEIRTPMNGVLGMLDLLSETQMTALQRSWLETAHTSAQSLLMIINDILDLSKLESSHLKIENVNFNLVEMVDDICALLAVQAHEKDLELNCAIPPELSAIWQGDPMRIRQILTNLIGNAIKFTLAGEVNVKISQLSTEPDELLFEVEDTGIGMPEDVKSRLFQSFSQGDNSTARRFGGTGLGLFISKKLVELMGGDIGVESTPDHGSCFWFRLPLQKSSEQKLPFQSSDFTNKNVLIVDDNATNRDILHQNLSNWGLTAHEVDSGPNALIELQGLAKQGGFYDLIILDMQMPVMDGLSLAKSLAQIPALANIPIILLSSSNMLSIEDYEQTNIVQRLLKPARQSQLFDAILNALHGTRALPVRELPPKQVLPSYQGKKVLVVEDNKINQKVIVAKLANYEISPDMTDNGQLALEKLKQNRYDLILMDCHMPVMDGYTATRELRLLEADRGLAAQSVVALTANALEGEQEKCLAAGMNGYLTKPISQDDLNAVLALYLGEQTPQETQQTPNKPMHEQEPKTDWNETAALQYLGGDTELLANMIQMFLSEKPQLVNSLTLYQQEGNLKLLGDTAHQIKGMVDYFFAVHARECARQLEQTARQGEAADYAELTAALVTALTDLDSAMRNSEYFKADDINSL